MSNRIPLSVPFINGNEWKYVKECLDSGWVSSSGHFVTKFEESIAGYSGSKHAIACVNGTSALHVALRLAGVGRGDEVIVPTVTFIAPVNAVNYVGAAPVFMDCDDSYVIDVGKTLGFLTDRTVVRSGLTFNKATGQCIRALLPVHVFGNPADLEPLIGFCRERGIRVIEDATESLGSTYSTGGLKQRHTGTVGDIGCLSFNGNKIITTGGGGMILTSSDEYARQARYLTTQAKKDEVRYVHDEVGYNYRMTNIQAALGLAQLELLPGFLKRKQSNYQYYKEHLDPIPGLKVAETPPYAESNLWMYALQVDEERFGLNREALMSALNERGVQSRPLWYLNHLQRPYLEHESYRIEKAPQLLAKTLNIPCSVGLTGEQRSQVVEAVKECAR